MHSENQYPVGGDISANGKEILIKSYENVFYWERSLSTSVGDALQTAPAELPYTKEAQGESICWEYMGNNELPGGYFTVSEGANKALYYYERINNTSAGMSSVKSEMNFVLLCVSLTWFILQTLSSLFI